MFDWFFKVNVQKQDDTFARTAQGKLLGLKSTIKETLNDKSQRLVLVSHFADTFSQVHDMLEQHEIDFEVPTSDLDQAWYGNLPLNECRVQATFAKKLNVLPARDQLNESNGFQLTLIATERHPQLVEDDRIEQFCQSFALQSSMGLFLVVRRCFGERTSGRASGEDFGNVWNGRE